MQTKVIFCNSANKSCLLQVVHTKAIAALTQFCDFFSLCCILAENVAFTTLNDFLVLIGNGKVHGFLSHPKLMVYCIKGTGNVTGTHKYGEEK